MKALEDTLDAETLKRYTACPGLDIHQYLVENKLLNDEITRDLEAARDAYLRFLKAQGISATDVGFARYSTRQLSEKPFEDGKIRDLHRNIIPPQELHPTYTIFIPNLHAKLIIFPERYCCIRSIWDWCGEGVADDKNSCWNFEDFKKLLKEENVRVKSKISLTQYYNLLHYKLFGKINGIKIREAATA